MIVREQKPLRFRRSVPLRVHWPTLAKAMLWYNQQTNAGKPMAQLHTVFTRGRGCYPAVSIHGEKIMVHVLLMMFRLQGNVPEDKVVHHRNEDRGDARKDNLSVEDHREHSRRHNTGPDCARWRGRAVKAADPGRLQETLASPDPTPLPASAPPPACPVGGDLPF